MQEINCDVLIIGSGPSGLSAAISCGEKKLNTIIVEKQHSVGNDVRCAEGVGAYLFDFLPFDVNFGKKWKIEGMDFFCDDYVVKRRGKYWSGFTIDRSFFEKDLLKKLISKGVKTYFGFELSELDFCGKKSNIFVNKVIIKQVNGSKKLLIKPKVLIAADGSFSVVSKELGLFKPRLGETGDAYSFELSNLKLNNPRVEQLFVGDFAEGGYGFIFPKSKTVANVGIGSSFKRKKISEMYETFTNLPVVSKQLKKGVVVKDKTKEVIWGDVIKKMRYGNVIFCGDAANHNLKPFIEGILPGVISGYVAGNFSEMYLENSEIDLQYVDLIDARYREIWDYSKEIQNLSLKIFFSKERLKKNLLFFSLISQQMELDEINNLLDKDVQTIKSLIKNQNLRNVKEELKK